MVKQISLADSSGALFSLKEVSWTPEAPKMKEPFTIKGKIELLNLPFLALVWANASITYPKQITDILGAPVAQETSMAWFGNFTIKFPEGFDREGEYKLDLNVYAGPTTTTSLSFITSKSVTLPPFPPVMSLPTQTFTVSGEMPPEQKQYTIGKPTVTPAQIFEGTKVTISVPVTSGATQQETVTVRLKVDYGSALPGPGNTIKTINAAPIAMAPGASKTFTFEYTEVAPNDGRRDTEVDVLVNGESKGYDHQNDLWTVLSEVLKGTILSIVLEHSGLYDTLPATNIPAGGTGKIHVHARNDMSTTQAMRVIYDVFASNHTTVIYHFDSTDHYANPSQDTDFYPTLDTFNIPSTGPVYVDASAQINGVTVATKNTQFAISGGGATGSITAITLEYSSIYIDLPATSIPINAEGKIHIKAVNNSASTKAARVVYTVKDPSGAAIYSFDDTDSYAVPGEALDFYPTLATFSISAAGIYSVVATLYLDGVQVATKSGTFTVGGGGVTPTVTIINNNAPYGSQVQYSFSGFQPYAQIYATIQGQGSAIDYPFADGSGNGLSYFYAYIDPGTYTLVVTDNYGHSATASLTVVNLWSFSVGVRNTAAALPGATYWWAYYHDLITGEYVSDGKWHPMSETISFTNVNNGGRLLVFVSIDQYGSQINGGVESPPIPLVANNMSLYFDAATGEVTSA